MRKDEDVKTAHAILLSTAFRKIVFMMAQWKLDRTSARYVKKKYIHCYIIMRLNTCYNQDGAGEFYLHYIFAQRNTRVFILGASCLKIGGELSGANCPGGELSGYPLKHFES